MDDPELMREILNALLDDTSMRMGLLEAAIRGNHSARCVRLAHYSKGACTNVGANRAAELFRQLESKAAKCEFSMCAQLLAALVSEMDLLRKETLTI
jgi:HPt (histidine-containing phosphotransfer) domain-containing protein